MNRFLHILCAAILWLTAGLGSHLRAHTTRIDQVSLIELGENRYAIRYAAPPPGMSAFGTPLLPSHARWVPPGNIPLSETSTSLVFETADRPLTATDRIVLPWLGNGVLVEARWRDGRVGRQFFTAGKQGIVIELASLQAGSGSWQAAARRYFNLGFEHLLGGIEHLLFVLGLLLLVKGTRRLVLTITAFTLAHSVTLGFAVLGWFRLPQAPVEAIVAMSLVLLAVENLRARAGNPGLSSRYPWIVAFLFGLIHGLSFSGALEQVGLARAEIPPALLFFNLGIEAGQLAFLAACLLLAWPLKNRLPEIPAPIRLAPQYLLGTLGAYWAIERTFAILAT